jgi:glycosyltransferase involved in cell wall biosynthesis
VRVALVHDWLTGFRGGERVLHQLALLYPDADLFTLIHVPDQASSAIEELSIHPSPLSRLPGSARHYRKLLPLFPWAIERFDLSGYDLVISCSHAVAKGVRVAAGTVHVCYCLTPMRYVWDQIDVYLGRGPRRLLAWPLAAYLRRFDVRTSTPERVTRFVAISRAVAARIRSHYDRPAEVVHPPVAVDRIRPSGAAPNDFYLLVGGFVPYKREDVAVEAFRTLGRTLVVVGDGPTRRKVQAGAPANVRFVGRCSDDELAGLYRDCRALVHPQEEDFGITAVEAQAAGRPVIALGRGGALDTLRPLQPEGDASKATGICFEDPSARSLTDAVRRFEAVESRFDAGQIRAWAERFSPERFRAELQHQIEAAQRAPIR